MKNIPGKLAAVALLLSSSTAFAASFDAFLEIEGIKGESEGKIYKGPIDSAGVVKFGEVVPGEYLVRMCANGQHIKSAQLSVRKAGTEQKDFVKGGTVDIQSFSFGATQHGAMSGNRGAGASVGKAEPGAPSPASATGGGSGKASFQDLHFVVKSPDGKPFGHAGGGSGGGAGKVSMQDFHFAMNPAPECGPDMDGAKIGTVVLVAPSDGHPNSPDAVSFTYAKIEFKYDEQK